MSDADLSAAAELAMAAALDQARLALLAGEVPVGAAVARAGRVIAAAHNRRQGGDPLAHAELIALGQAARAVGDWRLSDCLLAVTLEPCPMCAGAMVMARLGTLVFGAYDPAYGCGGSALNLTERAGFPWRVRTVGGWREAACAAMLRDFFAERRADP
ncbi:MAG: nucleoside deaminase [Christensenellales bacterium]|jgi:tRNA(adenine34) deaminase